MAQPEAVLALLAEQGPLNTQQIAIALSIPHDTVIGLTKSLQCHADLIACEAVTTNLIIVTDEGRKVAAQGSHEARVFSLVTGSIPLTELQEKPEYVALGAEAKIGFSKAMQQKWIVKDGNNVKRNVDTIQDLVRDWLQILIANPQADTATIDIPTLAKRNFVAQKTIKSLNVSKGKNFALTIVKPESDLTTEMLLDGSWASKSFKKLNLDALGKPVEHGTLHPLLKVRAEYREIFLEMGFTEMPTNNFVESSFWNFDALFQPQQHPARDMHDTFFLSEPRTCAHFGDAAYGERVKTVHEKGGYGSQGYHYDWSADEASKNILRTHTTAVSARMLYKLAQQKPFQPAKYFSIDRVFRNESLDATHLAEFHQIEGLIADRGLTLGDLMGTLEAFFKRLGIKNLKFKPAYNPYTEPSLEVFSYHEGLNKVVEIGNSGVFRPEMLRPMGLPDDVVVIAWGLSLERPTMIKYGYKNIRDLVGHKVDLEAAKSNPICRI
eukprot:m.716108 g.716108  ORF g.716108 m.716108 type:complete len:494 (-) comp58794_c0_seq2:119-1600(-)